jgi:kynurenine formamidase
MPGLIDLTLTLSPGQRGVESEPKFTVARDGWNAATWHLYSHTGTHMDAQLHFEAGPETIDTKPLEACLGPAWVVGVSPVTPHMEIGVSHLGAIAGRTSPGDSLLLRTGWSRHAGNPATYRDALPRISEDLARWCVDQRLRMLGVEPPSVADVNNLEEVTRIHRILLGGGVTIVEGLVHLDRLTRERVFFCALPLKLAGGDGSPVRAFAFDTDPSQWPAF